MAPSPSSASTLLHLPGPSPPPPPRGPQRGGWRNHPRWPRHAAVRCSFAPVETARIKVVGVGGGGNNAVNRMIGSGLQIFSENMGKKSEPQITMCKQGENWTKVTFKPDLAKFNMTHLEDDVVALMRKRVVDMAGTLGKTVKVELNGQRVPVKSFSDYVDLYLRSASMDGHELPRVYQKVNDRWEVCVSPSEGQFQQVSVLKFMSSHQFFNTRTG